MITKRTAGGGLCNKWRVLILLISISVEFGKCQNGTSSSFTGAKKNSTLGEITLPVCEDARSLQSNDSNWNILLNLTKLEGGGTNLSFLQSTYKLFAYHPTKLNCTNKVEQTMKWKDFKKDKEEYCIKNISGTDLTLEVCVMNETDCSESDTENICVPKCCDADEVLDLEGLKCRKIQEGEHKWTPRIHRPVKPYDLISDKEDLRRVHVTKRKLPCDHFEKLSLSNALSPKDPAVPWKLIENKRPIFLSKQGEWISIPEGAYCVDGIGTFGSGGNANWTYDNSVILLCPDKSKVPLPTAVKTLPSSKPIMSSAVIQKCKGFQDLRQSPSDDLVMNVPGNLTNSDEAVDFRLGEDPVKLKCKDTSDRLLSWEDGRSLTKVESKIRGERLRGSGKNTSHFTHEGYFHDEGYHFPPEEYCVMSLSDTEIKVKTCDIECSDKGKICVPKCCGIDEVLDYWHFRCRKIKKGEPKWFPNLHNPEYPHQMIDDEDEIGRVHIKKQHLHCDKFEKWPLSKAIRPKHKDQADPQVLWKLLPNKRPIFLAVHREWTHIPDGVYCVDGFANFGHGGNGSYSGSPDDHSVLLLCLEGEPQGIVEFNYAKAWFYSIYLLFCSIFLLLTALVHVALIDKQHLHGLTVLCHSLSMFGLYVFYAIANIISIYPQLKGSNPRKGFCMAVAVLSHYFFMSTFTWLTVMNVDLWLTFRSMRPVSKMSKRIRRFRIYFLIGWGLPLILSSAFYAVDEIYRDKLSEAIVPDYADRSCFVAIWSRGYYMYSLAAIALAVNTILVLWTFYIFYEFREQNVNTFKKKSKSDKYSVRLFIKLFCVMGVAWFVELLSWFYNGDVKPWPVVVLDSIMYLQSFAIFFIFCVNRRTLKQLEEKFPRTRWLVRPIRSYKWFKWQPSDVDNMEMTTPGSTPRKMSSSITTHSRLDSTLPRKASGASTGTSGRSTAATTPITPKEGILEEVNLDSDGESGTGKNLKQGVHQTPDLITNMRDIKS